MQIHHSSLCFTDSFPVIVTSSREISTLFPEKRPGRSKGGRGPFHCSRHSMSPYTTLAVRPKVMTGPAMVNIFAAVPRMKPSAAVNERPNFSCRTEARGLDISVIWSKSGSCVLSIACHSFQPPTPSRTKQSNTL